jgi:hypothetical protein
MLMAERLEWMVRMNPASAVSHSRHQAVLMRLFLLPARRTSRLIVFIIGSCTGWTMRLDWHSALT